MTADTNRTAMAWALMMGAGFVFLGGLLCYLWGLRGLVILPCALGIGATAGYLVYRIATGVADGAGRGFLAIVQPSGKSSPYEPEFSQAQALAAADDIQGAIEWYDAEMTRQPDNVLVRVQSADLHARNGHPGRAEQLFTEARRLTSDRNHELYCTQRLIDLRLGPLNAPARALPELRRIMERFPDSREADGARVALARLKRELPMDQ